MEYEPQSQSDLASNYGSGIYEMCGFKHARLTNLQYIKIREPSSVPGMKLAITRLSFKNSYICLGKNVLYLSKINRAKILGKFQIKFECGTITFYSIIYIVLVFDCV